MKHVLRSPEPDTGGSGAPAPAPAAPAPAPAAPAPSPAAPAPAPAASAPAAVAPAADPPGFWNDKWRERLAGDDAKALGQLQRYQSPEDVWKKARSLEQKMSSGEFKPVLGKTATPEELKEYREAHGIPVTHDKYDLGKDVKIEDEDKPMFDAIFKAAHDSNQTPEQLKATVKSFYGLQKQVEEAHATRDAAAKQQSEDVLRGEWGGEFRRNINLVHGLLDGAGSQNLKASMLSARLPDGREIGSSPEAMKLLLGLALINNPAGVVVPGGDANRAETIDTEIATIEKRMREDRKGYDKDAPMQSRLRDLYDAREKFKPRK